MSSRKIIYGSLLLAALAFAYFAVPNHAGKRTRDFLGVVNTLRQIDAAKQQYVIDHKAPAGSTVTREQLLEYIPERFWERHAEYRLNAIGVLPEAVLPSRFDDLPAKTIIRLQTNSPGYLVALP